MEKAATTASSLEAKHDSDDQTRFEVASKLSNDPPFSRVNILGSGEDSMKPKGIDGNCCLPTATVNILDNGEQEITTTVDGLVKTVTIAFVRKYLKLADAGGLSSLPNTKFFDQLSLMRLLSSHKRTYITPTLTQKLFSNMKRVTKGYSGEETPLIPTMLAIEKPGQGEGSAILGGSQHMPLLAPSTETHSDTRAQSPITEPHTSPPQITKPPTSSIIRETIRQEVKIPQSNFPT
ncbi:hypothetical protein Tco_0345753 [Tanacetum coccineum]